MSYGGFPTCNYSYGLVINLRTVAENLHDYFLTTESNNYGKLKQLNALSSDDLISRATWRLVPGLANPEAYSLECHHMPGHYLRHKDFRFMITADDGQYFKGDATFYIRDDRGAVRFESFSWPGYYIRHYNYDIWLADGKGPGYRTAEYFHDCTTWVMNPALEFTNLQSF